MHRWELENKIKRYAAGKPAVHNYAIVKALGLGCGYGVHVTRALGVLGFERVGKQCLRPGIDAGQPDAIGGYWFKRRSKPPRDSYGIEDVDESTWSCQ